MQIEFLNMLKESRLYMPVSYGENMFEGIESAKVGDVIEPTVQIEFNIEFLTDDKGNKAVPLFTSDEMRKLQILEVQHMYYIWVIWQIC